MQEANSLAEQHHQNRTLNWYLQLPQQEQRIASSLSLNWNIHANQKALSFITDMLDSQFSQADYHNWHCWHLLLLPLCRQNHDLLKAFSGTSGVSKQTTLPGLPSSHSPWDHRTVRMSLFTLSSTHTTVLAVQTGGETSVEAEIRNTGNSTKYFCSKAYCHYQVQLKK